MPQIFDALALSAVKVAASMSKSSCAANRTDLFCPQVCLASDPVVQFILKGIVKQAIHGEVTSHGIGTSIAEAHLAWVPAVLLIGFCPECGYLKLVPSLNDHHYSEFFSHRERVPEEFFYFVRKR